MRLRRAGNSVVEAWRFKIRVNPCQSVVNIRVYWCPFVVESWLRRQPRWVHTWFSSFVFIGVHSWFLHWVRLCRAVTSCSTKKARTECEPYLELSLPRAAATMPASSETPKRAGL